MDESTSASMMLKARKLRRREDQEDLILFAIEDVTALQESYALVLRVKCGGRFVWSVFVNPTFAIAFGSQSPKQASAAANVSQTYTNEFVAKP